ncbi:acetyltransferase component of pyruvate dehydrogenase complex [Polymorphobacter glacialis]|uniref:Acetyltransferase component of pyruvate dehydrogenase complex n=1 Tax=Sandarakinorhabdus glacialis TaxID=1614636 RepID=A0A916ZMD0_9SPHN|nr:pyruvate dehydrogenase complex dihydrolipoamide acetyltransferase [Polymorphobacter glacialis]GGE04438.1 acetyltransferase component of pyruvate dehydrogenase complex [Polymorphobacter glacialis]
MIDINMPALSPTMETGTLSKWLVAVGDVVKSGDVLAEIETDKATMEVESIDEGTVAELVVAAGTEGVPVGQVIMRLAGEGEDVAPAAKATPVALEAPKLSLVTAETPPAAAPTTPAAPVAPAAPAAAAPAAPPAAAAQPAAVPDTGARVNASPLARRIAEAQGIALAGVTGTGPNGRIVRADVDAAAGKPAAAAQVAAAAAPATVIAEAPAPKPAATPAPGFADIPQTSEKLGNVRKVIARRLTEAKQTVPHFYLTSDIRIDALLKLRGELNKALEPRKIKLSVNDMVIKALALALRQVPKANVSFAGDTLISYSRADISVAVAAPSGLITPIIVGADLKPMSVIATEMQALAAKAREGKLQPHEYQGGTASVSNLGMYGIKQFDAVINPPQGMILAVGAGEKRPYLVDDALAIATVMTVTGSFDHRAIDGADGAELMSAVKALIESPLGLVA